MDSKTISLITIPLFTGAIGYVTNWTGVWMLFYPIRFRGFRVPGLKQLSNLLPRRLQQIPGVMQGGFGWQGIVPSRAAKMGSIAVDKGIAKLGGAGDFYERLDSEAIAEHVLENASDEIHDVVDRIMEREHPQLWRDLPPRLREAVHARVQEQLPALVHSITEQIGAHVDQLLNVKLMVIRRIEETPELANRIFLEVGRRELRLIVYFGFVFGFLLGIPTAFLTVEVWSMWWLLPISGVLIGYTTNLLGIRMIFEPVRPRRIGPLSVQGLFLKRQPEVAEVYAEIIADDIVTVGNMAEDLLHGPSSDRTRADDRGRAAPGGRQRGRPRPARGAGRGRRPRVRPDPLLGRGGGRRPHDGAAHRPGVRQGAEPTASANSWRRGCAGWTRPTSPRCCAPRCGRTSGCSTSTAPCSASAPA